MLLLVRHAMPIIAPDVPALEWRLSDDGRRAAAALTKQLPNDAYLAASGELRAAQTLGAAGVPVQDPRFNEVARPREPWQDSEPERRRAYVDGTDHRGWEPRSLVAQRFDEAVLDHLAAAAHRPLVVATHGMAMTIWLTARIELPDPGAFWTELRFPDAHRIDLEAGTATRLSRR